MDGWIGSEYNKKKQTHKYRKQTSGYHGKREGREAIKG